MKYEIISHTFFLEGSEKQNMAKEKVYNKVFTEAKWLKVNKYNKKLLEDYCMQIKAEGKSLGTQKQYYNDARIILIYILEEHNNKALYRLNRKSFRNLTLWMQERGMSPARINRMLSTSRNLLNFGNDDDEFAEDFEDCKANPNRIKGIQKEGVRNIVFLTDEEIHIIFNKLMERKLYSQALLCGLMYDSACRRNEAYQVKRDDISLDGTFTSKEVVGKRSKKFKLMYHDLTKKAFKALEENRLVDNNEIWITQLGELASYETLYTWVISWRKILEEETGEYKEFNAHSFRHSSLETLSTGEHYVARKLNKKFTIQELKLLAHHESIETTDGYLRCKDEEMLLEAFGL